MKNLINNIQKNMTLKTSDTARKFFGATMMFAMVTSWAYGLLPFVSPNVKTAEAATAWGIRQEVNITNRYMEAASGAYASSSAIARINPSKYSGTSTYYFEVVASTSVSIASNVYLKTTAGVTVATAVIPLGTTNPTLIRSTAFTPNSSATDYMVVIGNESGATKSIKASRVVILQSFAGTTDSAATSTQTQIEIGSYQTYSNAQATTTFSAPKYWYYDSSKWDGTTTFYAEVTYEPLLAVASSTTYSTAGTYSVVLPAGTASTTVALWGGGGAGGASTGTTGGDGGAGGQYARSTLYGLSGITKTLVVGASRAGGAGAGSNGNDSTWDTSVVVAKGGTGGQADSIASTTGSTTGCVGDVCYAGGSAGKGTATYGAGGGGGAGSTGAGGSATGAGVAGTGTTVGGGNGGAVQSTNAAGNNGTQAGGGGGGGKRSTGPTKNGGTGAAGQAIITNYIATTTIVLQESDGTGDGFVGWTDKAYIVVGGSVASSTRVRSSAFTPTSGRNYRIAFRNGDSRTTFGISNAKIIVDQTSASEFTLLEPQYLLANTSISSGTALQSNLTKWDSNEWSNTTNTYVHQVDAANNSTSVVTVNTAETGTLVTGSTVTSPDNRGVSSALTMPANGNLDMKATTNNGDVYASRILVQVAPGPKTISGTVLTGIGGAAVGSGKTVSLYKNGSTLLGSAVTDSNGIYSISASVKAGDILTAYINGDALNGVTVCVSDGQAISDLSVMGNVLFVRDMNGGGISNANLKTGYVSAGGADMVYTADASNNLTLASNIDFYINQFTSYTTGGTITTQGTGNFYIGYSAGVTFDVGPNTIAGSVSVSPWATLTINADMTINGGSLTTSGTGSVTTTAGTPTVTLSGAGTLGGGTGNLNFYNLTIAPSSSISCGTSNTIAGALTVGSGSSLVFSSGRFTTYTTFGTTTWSISNAGTLVFEGLNIYETPTTQTSASFSVGKGLYVLDGKTFAPTGGTVTMTGGVISNLGSLSFYNLAIGGSVSTGSTFNVINDLTSNSLSSLSTSGGLITVEGNFALNGTVSGSDSIVVRGGNVIGDGTLSLASGVLNLQGVGSFGGNTNWNAGTLDVGVPSETGKYQTAVVNGGQIYVSSDYGNTWTAKDSDRGWMGVSISSTGQYQTAVVWSGQIYNSSDYGNTWTAKESSRTWRSVSISSSGQYQTAVAQTDQIYISSDYGNTWTAKDSSRLWYNVSLSSTGQYQTAVVYGGQIYVSSDYGNTWTAKQISRNWQAVSVSTSGQYQTAVVYGGQIYISSDYGNTWTAKDSNRNWYRISVSSSGQYQIALVDGGQIYISSDYGNTWTAKESSRSWTGISVSSTGQYQTAVVQSNQIYISSDYGNTWTAKESGRVWSGIAISNTAPIYPTGKYQTAVVYGGQIYISSNYGNTWTAKESSRNWYGLSVSSTGQYQTAIVDAGQIYVSSDYGNTWTAKDSSRGWSSVAISSTGQYQTAIVSGGQIYISSDYGNTWTAKDSSRSWNSVSISSTGQYQTAIVYNGQIYISSDYGNTWTAKDSNRSWYDVSMSNTALSTSVSTYGTGSITTSMVNIFNTFDLGSKVLELTSSSEPLKIFSGSLIASSSTIRYSGASNTTITPATYYNLELSPTSGTPTYTLGTTTGQTLTVNNNLTLAGTGTVTVDADTQDPIVNVNGNMTVGSGDTFQTSNMSTASISGDMSVSGTLSGSGNVVVQGGDATGNGTINLTGGNFTLDGTGLFGGNTNWVFNQLFFGDGSGVATTTSTGTNSITVATTTVRANQILDAGVSKTWNITSAFEPLQLQGTLLASSSTFSFQTANNATITPATYYNLTLAPTSGTPTYKLGTTTGQTFTTNNNFTLGGAGQVTVDVDTYDPTFTVQGAFTVGSGSTFLASHTSLLNIAGNFTNSGTFTANGGSVSFTTNTSSVIDSASDITFNNLSAITPGATLKFKSRTGGSPVFSINGTMTVTGSQSTPVYIESNNSGTQWLVNFLNPQNSITYASIRDAGCKIGSAVVTSSNTNTNRGNNDTCWGFLVVSGGGGAAPSIGGESGGGAQVTGGGGGRGNDSVESGGGAGVQSSGGTPVGVGQASP